MSAAEEITDDEFQFYKQELQKNVKEYLQLGDELDALKKAAKERSATKKEVTEKIIDSSQYRLYYRRAKGGVYNSRNHLRYNMEIDGINLGGKK